MSKIIIAPGKYVQGPGELSKLDEYTSKLGKKVLILATAGGMERSGYKIKTAYEDTESKIVFETHNGECSTEEIDRLKTICSKKGIDVIVGIGGGKTLDTAKAVAHFQKLPIVIVPTIASTDAPCSALSVIYTPEGEFESYLFLPSNPQVVIMDTEVIASSPARLTVAGMGDALATYFEARACVTSNAGTCAGGTATSAAFALSELCYNTLIEDGYKAKLAAENKVTTPALDKIIEANTLLSGIGFESCGLAAAHAIHNGFTVLEDCHHLYHGEKVAFGTIAQLVMENAPIEELEEVIGFCKSVGLPTTLEEMGIKEVNPEDIMKVAEASSVEGETIHNMPFPVTAETVYAALITADALGKQFQI